MTDDVRGESTGPKPLPGWVPPRPPEVKIEKEAEIRRDTQAEIMAWVQRQLHERTPNWKIQGIQEFVIELIEANNEKYRGQT